jgi:hypothetical protein
MDLSTQLSFSRLHKSLSHPYVVKMFSYFDDSNFVYIILGQSGLENGVRDCLQTFFFGENNRKVCMYIIGSVLVKVAIALKQIWFFFLLCPFLVNFSYRLAQRVLEGIF